MKKSYIWWGLGGLVFIAMLSSGPFLSRFSKKNPANPNLSNREVAMLCTTDMATEFHIHPNVQIVVKGEQQEMPKNIGIKAGCMNPLHTHEEADGTVHVESPVERDFTLSDFFAVWGKPFSKEQVLDYRADETYRIRVQVNGRAVDTYENTILRDMDRIVISYESTV